MSALNIALPHALQYCCSLIGVVYVHPIQTDVTAVSVLRAGFSSSLNAQHSQLPGGHGPVDAVGNITRT